MKFWLLAVASLVFLAQCEAQGAGTTASACSFNAATADAKIAAAFNSLGGTGTVDATCFGKSTVTLAGPISLKSKQVLMFSSSTEVRPASESSDMILMTYGAEVEGLNVDLSTLPKYSGRVVNLVCTTGAPDLPTTISNLKVHGANSAGGTALWVYCDKPRAGLAFVTVNHLFSTGLSYPIVFKTSAPGSWINGNIFTDIKLVGSSLTPMTGITLINDGLEIRGNLFTGFQIEGNGAKESFGINFANTGSQMIRSNIFEGSMWDLSYSWRPPASGVMGNILIGNMDVPPVDNGANIIYNLLAKNPGVEMQELTLSRHITQSGANRFAGTCRMNDGRACSFTIESSFAMAPVCIATVQSEAAIAGGCTVNGKTVTITGASPNNNVWGAVLIGNPN